MQLTWDETDHDRVTALNRKFNKEELLDMDFKAYLASSSEDEDEDELVEEEQRESADDTVAADKTQEGATVKTGVKESAEEEQQKIQKSRQQRPKKEKSEEQLSKYRDLLRGIQDKEKKLQEDKDMEMEITWVPGETHSKTHTKTVPDTEKMKQS